MATGSGTTKKVSNLFVPTGGDAQTFYWCQGALGFEADTKWCGIHGGFDVMHGQVAVDNHAQFHVMHGFTSREVFFCELKPKWVGFFVGQVTDNFVQAVFAAIKAQVNLTIVQQFKILVFWVDCVGDYCGHCLARGLCLDVKSLI